MDDSIKTKLDKLANQFTLSDYQEAIILLEEKRKILQQQEQKLKEKKAAMILLDNMESLLKNKTHLDPEFIKQIESLKGDLKTDETKKRGRKKKSENEKNPLK